MAVYYAFRNTANRIVLRMEAITMELVKDLRNVEVVVVGGSGNIRWSANECGYRRSVDVDEWR